MFLINNDDCPFIYRTLRYNNGRQDVFTRKAEHKDYDIMFKAALSKQLSKLLGKKKDSVDFQGRIDAISIEGIFQLLYYASLSGKLLLLNPPDEATFYFKDGKLTWGTLHKRQKQIGQRLIESSNITDQQLRQCLKIQTTNKQQVKLGKILIDKGFLQSDILHDSLKDQVKDAFFDALKWKQGTFAFVTDLNTPGEEIIINERIDHLLLEGIIQIDRNLKN